MVIRSEKEWREIIAAWERSDLTISQFCKSNRVGSSGFYKWLKRFRGGESSAKAKVVGNSKQIEPSQEFIPIDVPNLSMVESKTMLYIMTSYGARLEIPL